MIPNKTNETSQSCVCASLLTLGFLGTGEDRKGAELGGERQWDARSRPKRGAEMVAGLATIFCLLSQAGKPDIGLLDTTHMEGKDKRRPIGVACLGATQREHLFPYYEESWHCFPATQDLMVAILALL